MLIYESEGKDYSVKLVRWKSQWLVRNSNTWQTRRYLWRPHTWTLCGFVCRIAMQA